MFANLMPNLYCKTSRKLLSCQLFCFLHNINWDLFGLSTVCGRKPIDVWKDVDFPKQNCALTTDQIAARRDVEQNYGATFSCAIFIYRLLFIVCNHFFLLAEVLREFSLTIRAPATRNTQCGTLTVDIRL